MGQYPLACSITNQDAREEVVDIPQVTNTGVYCTLSQCHCASSSIKNLYLKTARLDQDVVEFISRDIFSNTMITSASHTVYILD